MNIASLSRKLTCKSFLVQEDNFFEKQNEVECAAFSSAYLLRHFGKNVKGFDLYKEIPAKHKMKSGTVYPKGVTFLLKQYGYESDYCTGNLTALFNEVAKGNPVIVLIKTRPDKNWLHYDTVVGYDEESVYLAESYPSLINQNEESYNRKISLGEFKKLWRTRALKMPLYGNTFYRVKEGNRKEDKPVSVDLMRRSDKWTIDHICSSRELMYRAGRGIFEQADWKAPVLIVCGKGNNAGDGFVVADLLKKDGIDCKLLLLSDEFSEDGRYYYDIAVKDGVPAEKYMAGEKASSFDFSEYGSILDCIFGTGFRGEVRGTAKEVIEKINASGAYIVSADINSGLNGDTGTGSTYVKSDLTVSIGNFKYGHFRGDADLAMKTKVNVDIGIHILDC